MTNQEVFRAFARGHEAEGGSVRSKRHLNDGEYTILYSYSTPIALRNANGEVFFDARRYSVTTSKQQSQAKVACDDQFTVLDHEVFRGTLRDLGVYLGMAR